MRVDAGVSAQRYEHPCTEPFPEESRKNSRLGGRHCHRPQPPFYTTLHAIKQSHCCLWLFLWDSSSYCLPIVANRDIQMVSLRIRKVDVGSWLQRGVPMVHWAPMLHPQGKAHSSGNRNCSLTSWMWMGEQGPISSLSRQGPEALWKVQSPPQCRPRC